MPIGKIIKKLKILDYLILTILFLIIIGAFIFFRTEKKWVPVLVLGQDMPLFQANSFHVGDIEKNASGKKIAEITKIESYDTAGQSIVQKDVFLETKILVNVNPKSGDYEYKNKPVKIGGTIDLRFNSVQLQFAKVIDIDDIDRYKNRQIKTITFKVYNQWDWFADSIHIGDKYKTNTEETIIEIISKETRPSEILVDEVDKSSGQVAKAVNPHKLDIILKTKINAYVISSDTLVIQRNKRIQIGSLFSFPIGNTIIQNALVTNIE